jgi:hypothetical protein
MSAPHSFVYRVSAVPAAAGADVIASRRAAIDARVASEICYCARMGAGMTNDERKRMLAAIFDSELSLNATGRVQVERARPPAPASQ